MISGAFFINIFYKNLIIPVKKIKAENYEIN